MVWLSLSAFPRPYDDSGERLFGTRYEHMDVLVACPEPVYREAAARQWELNE